MIDTAIDRMVTVVRAYAKDVKDNAADRSEAAVTIFGDTVRRPVHAGVKLCQAYLNLATTIALLATKLTEPGENRVRVVELLRHLQVDAGNRLNEVGNLIQSLAGDEEFKASAEALEKSFNEAAEGAKAGAKKKVSKKTAKKRTKKAGFSVVKD